MHLYPARALERAMKIKEVITRAMSGNINWIQAAEILGMSDRQLRRWRKQWGKHGYNGWQRRLGLRPCTGREPRTQAERQPLYMATSIYKDEPQIPYLCSVLLCCPTIRKLLTTKLATTALISPENRTIQRIAERV